MRYLHRFNQLIKCQIESRLYVYLGSYVCIKLVVRYTIIPIVIIFTQYNKNMVYSEVTKTAKLHIIILFIDLFVTKEA